MTEKNSLTEAEKTKLEEYRKIAERYTILRTQIGSGVHGTAITGTDDRDEMGICIEPADYVIGLRYFEQYEYHSAWERGGRRERSGPGDLDEVTYSFRKWMRLALAGNPSILTLLFVPDNEIVTISEEGHQLRNNAGKIISRQAGMRFAGYLQGQRDRLLRKRSLGVNRPELIEKYGFDVKYAAHMVRLGLQGVELLSTGRITLPMPALDRSWIRELRMGKHTQQEALDRAEELEEEILLLMSTSELPETPDYKWANKFLAETYIKYWGNHR